MISIKNEISSFITNLSLDKPQPNPPTSRLPMEIAKDDVSSVPKVWGFNIGTVPKYGDRGEDVRTLQRQLNDVRKDKIAVDGIFKKQTMIAISEVQKLAGLPGSGTLDAQTMALLNLSVSSTDSTWMPTFYSVKSKRNFDRALVSLVVNQLLKTDPTNFRKAVEARDGNLVVSMVCQAFVAMKVRERTNHNDGPIVFMIQKVTGGSQGDAWCMDMQQSAIMVAESLCNKTSDLPTTGSCASMRRLVPGKCVIDKDDAERGDLAIFIHTETGEGHTGNLNYWLTKYATADLLEGNTTQGFLGSKIDREGGGAYETHRVLNTPTMKVAMWVRPFVDETT